MIFWFRVDGDLGSGFKIAFVKISVQNYNSILLSTTRFECGLDIMAFYLKLCVRFCSRFDVTFPGFRHFDNSCFCGLDFFSLVVSFV